MNTRQTCEFDRGEGGVPPARGGGDGAGPPRRKLVPGARQWQTRRVAATAEISHSLRRGEVPKLIVFGHLSTADGNLLLRKLTRSWALLNR